MAAFMRCSAFRQRNLGQSFAALFSASSSNGLVSPGIKRFAAVAAQNSPSLWAQANRKLDHNEGISSDLYKTLFESLNKAESPSDQDVGLLLHVCSAGPFDAPVQKRIELADEIWGKLESLGVQPSIRLYNIKLKVYCTNKKDFNPLDELMNIKALGLSPDKITYGYLLEGFCQRGDIDGANNVLEAMKTSQHLLGISIFNSFITGHLKAGSPEEAEKILEVIRSRGLEPTADSYFRFATHFAEEGDIDSVLEYTDQADSKGVPLIGSMLLDLYHSMVASGHINKAGQLLKLITEKGINVRPTVHKSCQLVSEGLSDSALQLFLLIPNPEQGKMAYNSGSFLLKAMIINGQSAQDVMDMADKIVEFNPKAMPHRNALLYAYRLGNADFAMQFLELMKAKNHQVKVPHIIPAVCQYRDTNNKEGLYKAISMLLELDGRQHHEDRFSMLDNICYPALKSVQVSREDIVDRFKDHEKIWNSVFLLGDLLKEGCATAVQNAEGKDLDVFALTWSNLESLIIQQLPDQWQSCVDMLAFLKNQKELVREFILTLNGEVVRKLAIEKNWEVLDQMLTAMVDKEIAVRPDLKQLSVMKEAPESITDKLDQLERFAPSFSRRRRSGLKYDHLFAMSKEDLEKYQRQNPEYVMPKVAQLNKAMDEDNLEQIKLKLRELQAIGFELSPLQARRLIVKLAALQDPDTALHYFQELRQRSGNAYRDLLPLTIANSLVKKGNIDEAIKLLEAASNADFEKDERSTNVTLNVMKAMLANASTLEESQQLHTELFKYPGLVSDSHALPVHAFFIGRVLDQADDDILIDQLMRIHQEYGVFPSMDRVLVRFIEKQDVNRLKKVMDLGISVFGSSAFHHRLALSFIQCGMPSRAATVLKTAVNNINERIIVNGALYFKKTKRIDCLKSLVEICRDLQVSKSNMLGILIEGYVAVDDLKKATEVLDQFTDNFVKPSKATIDLLVKAHASQSLDMPQNLQAYIKTKGEASKSQAESSTSSSESDSESDSQSSSEETKRENKQSDRQTKDESEDTEQQNSQPRGNVTEPSPTATSSSEAAR